MDDDDATSRFLAAALILVVFILERIRTPIPSSCKTELLFAPLLHSVLSFVLLCAFSSVRGPLCQPIGSQEDEAVGRTFNLSVVVLLMRVAL